MFRKLNCVNTFFYFFIFTIQKSTVIERCGWQNYRKTYWRQKVVCDDSNSKPFSHFKDSFVCVKKLFNDSNQTEKCKFCLEVKMAHSFNLDQLNDFWSDLPREMNIIRQQHCVELRSLLLLTTTTTIRS